MPLDLFLSEEIALFAVLELEVLFKLYVCCD